jgi:hypothetical protein
MCHHTWLLMTKNDWDEILDSEHEDHDSYFKKKNNKWQQK